MLSKEETKKWLLNNCINENGDLDLSGLDLSDFKGNVDISSWKVGGNLFQDYQEVGGDLYQGDQEVGRNLYQDEKKAPKDMCPDMCVEPDYKAEYERLCKELCEANMKIETLMWALGKAKEKSK